MVDVVNLQGDLASAAKTDRVAILASMVNQLTTGLSNLVDLLDDQSDRTAIIEVTGDEIRRLGWISERIAQFIDPTSARHRNGAEGWIMGLLGDDLLDLERKAADRG